MGWYQLDAFLHLFLSVLITGYVLFWAVMAAALHRHEPTRAAELLADIRTGVWPHVAVPRAYRIPFTWIGWLLLAALALTGLVGALGDGSWLTGGIGGVMTPLLLFKLLLFGGLVAGQSLMVRVPRASLAYLNLGLTVLILLASVALLR